MSVFSLNAKAGNPVTADTVENLCSQLGVSIEKEHEEDYRRLLAVFHDACESLMEMEGMRFFQLPLDFLRPASLS
jgi:amidase